MDVSEYLAFVPLLLYGIGLADLMSEWKRLLSPSSWYLPYSLFTIILTETALYNVFIYIQLIDQLPGQSYFSYLTFLLPPFLFLLTTYTFTPEKDSETKKYFIEQMPVFFTLLSLFVASHFLYQFEEPSVMDVSRVVIIVCLIAAGYFRKVWFVYVIAVLWVALFFSKAKVHSPSKKSANVETSLDKKLITFTPVKDMGSLEG